MAPTLISYRMVEIVAFSNNLFRLLSMRHNYNDDIIIIIMMTQIIIKLILALEFGALFHLTKNSRFICESLQNT